MQERRGGMQERFASRNVKTPMNANLSQLKMICFRVFVILNHYI